MNVTGSPVTIALYLWCQCRMSMAEDEIGRQPTLYEASPQLLGPICKLDSASLPVRRQCTVLTLCVGMKYSLLLRQQQGRFYQL